MPRRHSRTLAQAIIVEVGHDRYIRIDDTTNAQEPTHVGLRLTEAEARELRNTLDALLSDPGPRHEHVASADFKVELTISLDR